MTNNNELRINAAKAWVDSKDEIDCETSQEDCFFAGYFAATRDTVPASEVRELCEAVDEYHDATAMGPDDAAGNVIEAACKLAAGIKDRSND